MVCLNLMAANEAIRVLSEILLKDPRTIGNRLTARHRFLCTMAGELKDEAVLDLGCGFGWFEEYAVASGCSRVLGVDTDEASLERAKREVPSAEFLLDDATDIRQDAGIFGVVAMFDFMEHVPRGEEAGVTGGAVGHLAPGGRLLVSVPYRGLVSMALDPAFYFGHRHYKLRDLEAIISQAGLRISRAAYAGGIWEQLSLILLYISKWVFRREMPFADFLERKRKAEYEAFRHKPGPKAYVTMFVEAVTGGPTEACEP